MSSRLTFVLGAAGIASAASLAQTSRNRRAKDQFRITATTGVVAAGFAALADVAVHSLSTRTGMSVWRSRGFVAAGASVLLLGAQQLPRFSDGVSAAAAGTAFALGAGAGAAVIAHGGSKLGSGKWLGGASVVAACLLAGAGLALQSDERPKPAEGTPLQRFIAGGAAATAVVGAVAGVAALSQLTRGWVDGHALRKGVVASAMVGVGVAGIVAYKQLTGNKRVDAMPPTIRKWHRMTTPYVSGGDGSPSKVRFNDLSSEAALYVVSTSSRSSMAKYWGEKDLTDPVRAYVPLANLHGSIEDKARQSVDELERLGGLKRKLIVINVPTGSGDPLAYVDSVAEVAERGNVASLSVPYDNRPAPVSLGSTNYGADLYRAIFRELKSRLEHIDKVDRPRVVTTGYSLGAGVLWNATNGGDVNELDRLGIDRQLLLGMPASADSRWREHARENSAVLTEASVDGDHKSGVRTTVLNHADDAAATTSLRLFWDPRARNHSTDRSMFIPMVTAIGHAFDLSATSGEVDVQTNRFGHSYIGDLTDAVPDAFGLDLSRKQRQTMNTRLAELALQQSGA